MNDNDEHLERYLAEFQPRPIRKLMIPSQPKNIWFRRLSVAAVLVLGTGISLWLAHRANTPRPQIANLQQPVPIIVPPPQELSPIALTKLALENNQEFESYLLYESQNVLPDLQGEKSTLRVLVKE